MKEVCIIPENTVVTFSSIARGRQPKQHLLMTTKFSLKQINERLNFRSFFLFAPLALYDCRHLCNVFYSLCNVTNRVNITSDYALLSAIHFRDANKILSEDNDHLLFQHNCSGEDSQFCGNTPFLTALYLVKEALTLMQEVCLQQ